MADAIVATTGLRHAPFILTGYRRATQVSLVRGSTRPYALRRVRGAVPYRQAPLPVAFGRGFLDPEPDRHRAPGGGYHGSSDGTAAMERRALPPVLSRPRSRSRPRGVGGNQLGATHLRVQHTRVLHRAQRSRRDQCSQPGSETAWLENARYRRHRPSDLRWTFSSSGLVVSRCGKSKRPAANPDTPARSGSVLCHRISTDA